MANRAHRSAPVCSFLIVTLFFSGATATGLPAVPTVPAAVPTVPAVPGVMTPGWQWQKGSNMCGGIQVPCTTFATCTGVGFGPCSGAAPTFHVTYGPLGIAFVGDIATYALQFDPTTYVPTVATEVLPIFPLVNPNNGYLDFATDETMGDATFAFIAPGASFGSAPPFPDAGGYVGVAAYLVKTGSTTTTTNKFYYAKTRGTARKTRGTYMNAPIVTGAPDGPYNICISPLNGAACGAARTMTAGTYKFSLLGVTQGAEYAKTVDPQSMPVSATNPALALARTAAITAATALGLPTAVTHYGIRTKIKASADATGTIQSVSFNDATYADMAALGRNQVTNMKMTISDGSSMTMSFPQKYNVGDVNSDGTFATPTATKDVKIRVFDVTGETGAYYIDYLFDFADVKVMNKYVVYDPEVTPAGVTGGAPAPAAAGTTGGTTVNSTTTAVPGMFIFAVALVMHMFM